jgi:putative ABC transport system permease protein
MELNLTLALRYLSGRKLRTVLTTLAIVFGVLVIYGMNSMLPAVIQAFQANAMAAANAYDASITSKTGDAFNEDSFARVAAVPGVRAASELLERPISLPQDYFDGDPNIPDRVTAVTVMGVRPETARTTTAFVLEDGRFLKSNDAQSAVITESLAETAGLQVGDVLRLPATTGATDLTVVGLLPQRLMPGNEEVFVTLPEAQRIFMMPGQINTIRANFDTLDTTARRKIEQDIQAAMGNNFTIGVLQQNAEIMSNMYIAQTVFNLLGALGLLMGAFIIFNTFRTIVAERRRDIGMLRALGAERGTIMWMILIEGVIQGIAGTAAGLLFGALFARLTIAAITPILRQFINIQIPPVGLQPGLVAVSVLAGVGITLLAGLLPARAASRVSPLEALRPPVGRLSLRRMAGWAFWAGLGMVILAALALFSGSLALVGAGSLLFVTGLLLISPTLVDPIARLFGALLARLFARDGTAALAHSNLARQPGRAAITASTTMIALAILIMAASIISSVQLSFSHMLRESLRSDYLIIPPSVTTWSMNTGAAPALADTLRTVNGVDVVSTLRFASTQIRDIPVGMLGISPRDYQKTSGLTFQEGDPETAFRAMEAERGVIVNGLLATKSGLRIGDTLTALTANGEVSYTVVGIAMDYLNAKTTTGYISQENISTDFGSREDVFFQINLAAGANRTAVEAAFREALRPYPQFKLIAGQAYLDQNLALFNSMFAGMIALVFFLAIPSLIALVNTLAIGVIERRREIGMLRAVGATRRQIGLIILAEALILAAIGTAFGMLSGLYLGYTTVSAISLAGMSIDYVFPAAGMILGIASGLLFGVLAAVIPARQAAGMQIVAALRYE